MSKLKKTALLLLQEARARFREEDYEEALRAIHALVAMNANSFLTQSQSEEALWVECMALCLLGRDDEALASVRTSRPDWYYRSSLEEGFLADLGRYEEAITIFAQDVRTYKDVLVGLGCYAHENGDYEAAQRFHGKRLLTEATAGDLVFLTNYLRSAFAAGDYDGVFWLAENASLRRKRLARCVRDALHSYMLLAAAASDRPRDVAALAHSALAGRTVEVFLRDFEPRHIRAELMDRLRTVFDEALAADSGP